ncbi:MAG: DUF2726 domain-containing protein [Anaerolineae bacterium]|nr:DUF2726 domain-containing protein [Anaerolineae bacterium]
MSQKQYRLLRKILSALGLSAERIDELVALIQEWLGEDKQTTETPPPYYLRDDFITKAERRFYAARQVAVADQALIMAKVSLGDLFYPQTKDRSLWQKYRNKVDRKHVDFLLVDKVTLRPLSGIELDDSSHKRADRQVRDRFVDSVFDSAELPLLHLRATRTYDVAQISQRVAETLGLEGSVTPEATHQEPLRDEPMIVEEPTCPNCGKPMKLRTARQGANRGNQFWGCSGYPNCRTILPAEQ